MPIGYVIMNIPLIFVSLLIYIMGNIDISAWGSGVARFDGKAMPEPPKWDE